MSNFPHTRMNNVKIHKAKKVMTTLFLLPYWFSFFFNECWSNIKEEVRKIPLLKNEMIADTQSLSVLDLSFVKIIRKVYEYGKKYNFTINKSSFVRATISSFRFYWLCDVYIDGQASLSMIKPFCCLTNKKALFLFSHISIFKRKTLYDVVHP